MSYMDGDMSVAQFRAFLLQIPVRLRRDAGARLVAAAEAAAAEIRAGYQAIRTTRGEYKKHDSAHLAASVVVRKAAGGFAGGANVLVTSPHSHLYEFGTAERVYKGQDRGAMPAHPTVIPAARRHRAAAIADVINIVREAGFTVGPGE